MESNEILRAAETDASGHYKLSDLPRIPIRLSAAKKGYVVRRAAGGKANFTLDLAAGVRPEEDFELLPGGSITGRITDEQFEPLEGVLVELRGAGGSDSLAATAVTDDKGAYRAFSLEPGRYILLARRGGSETPPLYFPGGSDPRQARVIEVGAGTETEGIDLRFPSEAVEGAAVKVAQPASNLPVTAPAGSNTSAEEKLGSISGAVLSAQTEEPLKSATLTLSITINGKPATWTASSGAGGAFSFERLKAGIYGLEVQKPGYASRNLTRPIELAEKQICGEAFRNSSGFAVLAIVLAAVGLYAVMSFVVSRGTREIRIRLAPGASQGATLWLIQEDLTHLRSLVSQGCHRIDARGTRQGVYIRKTDGSPAVRLGDGTARSLSPDGKWAISFRGGPPPKVVLLPTGPGDQKPLDLPHANGASWFPGGRRLLLRGHEPDRGIRLYTMDLTADLAAAGPPSPVSREGVGASNWAAVSPDGKWIAATDSNRNPLLCPTVAGEVLPLPGGERDDLPVKWASPKELCVFQRAAAQVYRVDVSSGRRQLWKQIAPPDRTGLVSLTSFSMTPDGKSYAYSLFTTSSELYLVEGWQ